jgi:putative oligomerization/nucleic acid binding protein
MRRRAVGRAAVVGGAAYYAAKRGAEAGQQEQQGNERYDSPPEPQPAPDPIDQIKELNELRAQGILTDAEFAAEKKKLLGI